MPPFPIALASIALVGFWLIEIFLRTGGSARSWRTTAVDRGSTDRHRPCVPLRRHRPHGPTRRPAPTGMGAMGWRTPGQRWGRSTHRSLSHPRLKLLSNPARYRRTSVGHARHLSVHSPSRLCFSHPHLVRRGCCVWVRRRARGDRCRPRRCLRVPHPRRGTHARAGVRRGISAVPSSFLAAASVCLLKRGLTPPSRGQLPACGLQLPLMSNVSPLQKRRGRSAKDGERRELR